MKLLSAIFLSAALATVQCAPVYSRSIGGGSRGGGFSSSRSVSIPRPTTIPKVPKTTTPSQKPSAAPTRPVAPKATTLPKTSSTVSRVSPSVYKSHSKYGSSYHHYSGGWFGYWFMFGWLIGPGQEPPEDCDFEDWMNGEDECH